MDGRQIKELLNERAVEICQFLLPNGKVVGNEYVVGDIRGGSGKSLKIVISGNKTGVFKDFASSETHGDNLLELWRQVKDLSFPEAVQEAKDYLGVHENNWRRHTGTVSDKPEKHGGKLLDSELEPVKEGSSVWKWLTEERGIRPETIRAYKLGEAFIRKGERQCVVFPFYDPAGNLVRMKFRDINDKKYMFLHPKAADADQYKHGAAHHLFGIQAVHDTAESIVITEGELDAMSFSNAGYSAVSLPIGAQPHDTDDRCSHDQWIKNDYDWLETFVAIRLALDADEPGQQAARLLIPRLSRERVYLVDYPGNYKDANECILAGVNLEAIIANAKNLDPEELKRPRDFNDAVWEMFYPVDGEEPGDPSPWKLPFRFRMGEVTVWQGYNGHGKSIALDHCIVHFASNGRRACIASLEMPAKMTLQNMERQAIGKQKPETREEHDQAIEWLNQSIWIYDYVGSANSNALIEVFEYAARKYGIHHFVLDSMLKLKDVKTEDYAAQEDLLNRLNDFAKKFNVHVHVVCHAKKPDSKHPKEKNWPGEYDIKGSGSISDLAWNVVCMWRNEGKQNTIEGLTEDLGKLEKESIAAQEISAKLVSSKNEHDAMFVIQKQRTTGEFPLHKRLWFGHSHASDENAWSWQYGEKYHFESTAYSGV